MRLWCARLARLRRALTAGRTPAPRPWVRRSSRYRARRRRGSGSSSRHRERSWQLRGSNWDASSRKSLNQRKDRLLRRHARSSAFAEFRHARSPALVTPTSARFGRSLETTAVTVLLTFPTGLACVFVTPWSRSVSADTRQMPTVGTNPCHASSSTVSAASTQSPGTSNRTPAAPPSMPTSIPTTTAGTPSSVQCALRQIGFDPRRVGLDHFHRSVAPRSERLRTAGTRGARRPRLSGYRSDLNAARSSPAKSCGSSHAAKWPPLSSLL